MMMILRVLTHQCQGVVSLNPINLTIDSDDEKKKVESGINAKAADRVKHSQRWSQAYPQYEFVSKQFLRTIYLK